YKIATILFLVGYNFAPAAFAIGDISKLEGKKDQSVEVTTEETSEVPNDVPLDTSEDILEKGISDPASIAEGEGISSKEAPPFRTDVLQKASLSSEGQYTISSTSGIWTAIAGNPQHSSGIGTETVKWGTCYDYNSWGRPYNPHPCPEQSGLGFNGTAQQSFNPGEKFLIGDLTHYNWPIYHAATGATLKVTLNFSTPALTPNPTFTYDFEIEETTNSGSCPDWHIPGHPKCDDRISFPNSYGQEVFTIGDMKYTLVVDGFQKTYPTGSPISRFITEENKDNKAFLVGHLSSVLVEKPAISIVKKVNGEDANTEPGIYIGQGDPVAFEYVVQNTGNVRLTNITVTDDKGVNVSCPEAALEPGTNMTCTSTGTHTATLGLY
ncbi:MAG TPA: choice-of-anchor K domain-containing protein, partial [Candidatus Dojkabacteria bacterium]|nr:choice-of-anchor K domain-containing protein [Candidatus Dojkabacteria bacterium]